MKICRFMLPVIGALSVTACGGGGGNSFAPVNPNPQQPPVSAQSDFDQGIFSNYEDYAGFCANPRTDSNPLDGSAWTDIQGTIEDENDFLRAFNNDLYLWYDEVIDRNPALYDDPLEYFDTLKTTALSPSGLPKDRFHFTMDTDAYLLDSQAGISVGYGLNLSFRELNPPREILVNYVEPGSPAEQAGIERGWRLAQVNGNDIIDNFNSSSLALLSDSLFPEVAGESWTFGWLANPGSVIPTQTTIESDEISRPAVLTHSVIPSATGNVGYVVFNSHNAIAEEELVEVIDELDDASVTDLVLDMRYNGGGYLAIASQLAFMIAGPSRTTNATFERLQFNDKYPNTDPVTGQPLEPIPFYNQTLGFSLSAGSPLPSLDLQRVFIISGASTCSASESIINGLNGVGVEVILIGDTTCGKPYGFYPVDNCGTTYFTIQFRGVNATGFGDYPDGFSPQNEPDFPGVTLPGCEVPDDLSQQLGSSNEARLAAALNYRQLGSCPPLQTSLSPALQRNLLTVTPDDSASLLQDMQVSPFDNRILGLPQ